jgi:hypothetical protein
MKMLSPEEAFCGIGVIGISLNTGDSQPDNTDFRLRMKGEAKTVGLSEEALETAMNTPVTELLKTAARLTPNQMLEILGRGS